jgi:hypothetical protein
VLPSWYVQGLGIDLDNNRFLILQVHTSHW